MSRTTIQEVGRRLASAFRLTAKPLCIYGSGNVPEGAVHLSRVHRCIAAAMYRMATAADIPAVYLGGEEREGCCPGGITHMGYGEAPEYIRYFVSTGRADIRGGAAEYLKESPELVDRNFRAVGTITPPGKYTVIQHCEALGERHPGIRSLCCFGDAQTIRNLAALAHFDREDLFSPVIVPWGPSCATLVTYPAGMAEKAPKETVFLGPQDPTTNWAIPPDYLAIGIPILTALRMAANIDRSFIGKRPHVAFPERR
ncbi:MAG: DUF169 domain-containing protein [Methanomicrobiales archaeon]|nr:DUF169 domain-containing protein [Methanomicrobiales archaeon]